MPPQKGKCVSAVIGLNLNEARGDGLNIRPAQLFSACSCATDTAMCMRISAILVVVWASSGGLRTAPRAVRPEDLSSGSKLTQSSLFPLKV